MGEEVFFETLSFVSGHGAPALRGRTSKTGELNFHAGKILCFQKIFPRP